MCNWTTHEYNKLLLRATQETSTFRLRIKQKQTFTWHLISVRFRWWLRNHNVMDGTIEFDYLERNENADKSPPAIAVCDRMVGLGLFHHRAQHAPNDRYFSLPNLIEHRIQIFVCLIFHLVEITLSLWWLVSFPVGDGDLEPNCFKWNCIRRDNEIKA